MEPPHHDPAIYIIGRILDPNVVPVTFENVVVVACSNPSFRLHESDPLLAEESQLPVVMLFSAVTVIDAFDNVVLQVGLMETTTYLQHIIRSLLQQ